MKSQIRKIAVFFSLLLLTADQQAIWAQSGAGSIQGTVADSTGAVIPAASIHVVNVATGVATDTKSRCMLKTGNSYHELGATYLEQINKDQLQRYFVKRLQRLGLNVTVTPAIAA